MEMWRQTQLLKKKNVLSINHNFERISSQNTSTTLIECNAKVDNCKYIMAKWIQYYWKNIMVKWVE